MSKISRNKKLKKEPKERCQDCGCELSRRQLFHGKDPYASEIYGDDKAEDVCICSKCYKERSQDV